MIESNMSFSGLLERARAHGAALGAFTCYDLESGRGVLEAAAECDAPVVLLVSARSLSGLAGDGLIAGLRAQIRRSSVAAIVELDHVPQLPAMPQLRRWRPAAVMVDGSTRPFSDNLALTLAANNALAKLSIEVEGELGRLDGHEDVAVQGNSTSATDPDEAVEFVQKSGLACLAISVGNAHGPYDGEPELDLKLLRDLHARVPVPLALHGASGLPGELLAACVSAGVAKVNFNADLRTALFATMREQLDRHERSLDLLSLKANLTCAARKVARDKLALLGWPRPETEHAR